MTETTISEAAVRAALARFQDPETGRSVIQLNQVHEVQLNGADVSVTLGLTTWSALLWEEIRA